MITTSNQNCYNPTIPNWSIGTGIAYVPPASQIMDIEDSIKTFENELRNLNEIQEKLNKLKSIHPQTVKIITMIKTLRYNNVEDICAFDRFIRDVLFDKKLEDSVT